MSQTKGELVCMYDSNNVIRRVKKLIDACGKTREEIAKDPIINCDTSTVTKHYNGDRNVSAEYILKYALYFNVSTDYLLGLSDTPSTDKDIQFICDYTGLTKESVEKLHNDKFYEDRNIPEEEKNNLKKIYESEILFLNKLITENYLKEVSQNYANYLECYELENSKPKNNSKTTYDTQHNNHFSFSTHFTPFITGTVNQDNYLLKNEQLMKFNINQLIIDLINSCIKEKTSE